MKFKLQMLQWCILTGDPFPNHKLKNPNYICNKDANALLGFLGCGFFFRACKVLTAGNFIFLVNEPIKMHFQSVPRYVDVCIPESGESVISSTSGD